MKPFLISEKRILKSNLLVVNIGFALLLAISGCSKEAKTAEVTKDKSAEKAVAVQIETVKKAPLVLTIALTGSVEAGRIAQLASPAEGPVLSVRVREGDAVRRGQVLLTLGRTEGASALVSSLREDLKKEEDNLDRTRQLVKSGAIPGEQLDSAVANTSRMRAQLVKAQESTRDYVISAPWSGVVSKMKVRDGDFVGPRAPLAEIYQPGSLMIQLSLAEQDAAGIKRGMQAHVELDAYPDKRFSGQVTRLYPYLDPKTRTRLAEITLTDGPKLLPGMFARAFLVRETIADAITIPAHSLLANPGGGFAAFVIQDGKAVRRKLETGAEMDGRVRVLAGLNEGDKLIVGGQDKLKDGAAVKLPEAGIKNGVKVDKVATQTGTPPKTAKTAPSAASGAKP